jgi:L-2-hydroxyglutarate oxidase
MKENYDIAVIGGGIVGLATALALSENEDLSVVVLEAEDRLAAHQSSHNSGVIHSGIYYKPGSVKAQTCVDGRRLLYEFCEAHRVPYEPCGKLIIAADEREVPALNTLEERGRGNGLAGLRRLAAEDIREYEPHARGVAALWVQETGIVDFTLVCERMAEIARARGVDIMTSARVVGVALRISRVSLKTPRGEVSCKVVVNCGGLYCDRIAKMFGLRPNVAIIPFRGDYHRLRKDRPALVRNLIYPVPDPRFPFLGVHFTRKLDGTIEAGPNAVLAFSRTGYKKADISVRDLAEIIIFPGFWRLASAYWRTGLSEMSRSLSKVACVRALQRLVPEVTEDDLLPGGSGVRAQAVTRDGRLADDFVIQRGQRSVHLLNAPSPAATASLSIARRIAREARDALS